MGFQREGSQCKGLNANEIWGFHTLHRLPKQFENLDEAGSFEDFHITKIIPLEQ